MCKPVNEFMHQELKAWKDAVTHSRLEYKLHQTRLDFIYRVINKCGRDHMITDGEVERCQLDPILEAQ